MSKVPGIPIALIGFMGSGKTTIGKLLSSRLGLDFVDIDRVIAEEAGISIPEIFKKSGEGEFRRLESDALRKSVAAGPTLVLACGGGIVEAQENRNLLATRCLTLWLDVPETELVKRLRNEAEGRPMLAGDLESRVRMLLERRNPLYSTVAALRLGWIGVETPEKTVERIITYLTGLDDRKP